MIAIKEKLIHLILPFLVLKHRIYTLYIKPYRYNPERYKGEFVTHQEKKDDVVLQKANKVIYVFWTGYNEMSPNRKKSLESIKNKSGVKVILVTPDNLNDYLLPDYPLHPAYKYLSLVHKSDYLRGYFMYHHGGGYVDLKPCLHSWTKLFDDLNSSDKWCIGVREKYVGGVAFFEGNLGEDCRYYHNLLISNGGFIYKPHSPIAKEWLMEVHNRLDGFEKQFVKNSNTSNSENYPIPWSFILGQVVAPITLKYNEKVLRIDTPLFSTKNYR